MKRSLTAVPVKQHKIKHGAAQRPKVPDVSLTSASSIDTHKHIHIGSLGLEDPWQTRQHNSVDQRIYLHKFLHSFISILHKENYHKALLSD